MSSYANHVLFSSKLWIGHKLNEVSNTIVNVESNTWTDESIEQEWHRSLMLKFFQPSHNCRGTMKMGHSRLLLFFSVALIHLVIPTAAQHCYDTRNYTSNSTYRPQWLRTPKLIIGFTIFLLVKLPTKYTRLLYVEETLRPANAVVVSMGQVLAYWKLVQTKRRQSFGLINACFDTQTDPYLMLWKLALFLPFTTQETSQT